MNVPFVLSFKALTLCLTGKSVTYLYLCVKLNFLHQPLIDHGIGDLDKSGDIGALDVINIAAFLAVLDALLMYRDHDIVQPLIDFFSRPGKPHAVLRHL